MKNQILDLLEEELDIKPYEVSNIFMYGSRCYGTANDKSDYDITIVSDYQDGKEKEYNIGDYNFHILTSDQFKNSLQINDPKAIECLLWSKDNPIMERIDFELSIDKLKLRHTVSSICSNSWVKARKKIDQGDIYVGQKSLFHSIRIPMYAIQILESGKIIDWECANHYWDDISQIENWKQLKDRYKPIKNEIMTKFRKLCPKK